MKNLERLFTDEVDISNHIQNLRATTNLLHKAYRENPGLKNILLPQLNTLNDINNALCEDFKYCFHTGFEDTINETITISNGY